MDMKRLMWALASVLLVAGCDARLSEAEEKTALEKGVAIADASFQGLSAQLQQAMKDGGPAHAVEFCSLYALSIVDSLSAVHGAHIRRTSDRVRAPHDQPDAAEAQIMQAMLAEWDVGGRTPNVQPRAMVQGDSIAYYQPIFISSPACLKCHGTPGESLDASALAVISERYPKDQATGYDLGDLRGMWSIRWAR